MFDNYLPMSENEIMTANLLPDGVYPFRVRSAAWHVNQSNGNRSMKLDLYIEHKGRSHIIFCYLTPKFMKIFKHFHDTTGLECHYEAKSLTPELATNKTGRVHIYTDIPEVGSKYDPKNAVKDFIKPGVEIKTKSVEESKNEVSFNDDIPF